MGYDVNFKMCVDLDNDHIGTINLFITADTISLTIFYFLRFIFFPLIYACPIRMSTPYEDPLEL